MAEVAEQTFEQGDDLSSAAEAFTRYLSGDVAPTGDKAPEQQQDSPQTDQPAGQAAADNTDDEGAAAPVTDETASQPEPKPAVQAPAALPPEAKAAMEDAARAKQEAEASRDRFINALNTVLPQLQAQVQGEFSDIKSDDDLYALGESDPARFNKAVLALNKLNNVRNAQQRLDAQRNADVEWERVTTFNREIVQEIPAFADAKEGPILANKLIEYANANKVAVKGRTAAEVKMVYKAMLADESAAATATALKEAQSKAKGAPPVQKPGTTRQTNGKAENFTADFEKLKASGRVDDAAKLFSAILSG